MSKEEKEYQATDEDFNLAVQVIGAFFAERDVSFVLMSSATAVPIAKALKSQEGELALTAAVHHFYEQLRGETAMRVQAMRTAQAQGQDVSAGQTSVLKDPTN
jgi:hypothetical protein